MKLHNPSGTKKRNKKRLGRGTGSGSGKTSGRGTKGQKSRTGFNIPQRFEGGQTPLIQRLPKKGGFKSFRPKPVIIKTSQLDKLFSEGELITPKNLGEKGLIEISRKIPKIKILFDKPLSNKLKTQDILLSKKAQKYIEK